MPVTRSVDAQQLAARVTAWYSDHQRDLPWRRPGFTVWGQLVAEFMLQQTQVEEVAANTHVVSFVMPKEMSPEAIPTPRDAQVKTKPVAGFDAVVASFSGSWNPDRLHAKGEELKRRAKQSGLETTGNVMFARFNPPWMPWFLKRNEAMVALARPFS